MPADQPSASDRPDSEPFRHDQIDLAIEETAPNLYRVVAVVPGEQTKRFKAQIHEVNPAVPDADLAGLMLHLLAEETLERLDAHQIWAPDLVEGDPPPIFESGVDFKVRFDLAAFRPPDWAFLSGLTVRLPDREITEAMIDREELDQRLDAGTSEPVEGPVRALDELSLEIESRCGDKVVMPAGKITFRVPQESEDFNLPGIGPGQAREAVLDKNRGDQVTIETPIPATHPDPDLRGRTVSTTVVIESIRRTQPATIEQVLENYGMAARPLLRMQIRIALEQRFAEDEMAQAVSQLFPTLLRQCDFEVPEPVTRKLKMQARKSVLDSLEESNPDDSDREAILANLDSDAEATAQSGARESLLLYFLRLHLGVEAEDPEKTIQAEAAQRGIRPETYRKEILDQGRTSELQVRTLRRQLGAALLKQVRIERI